MPRTTVFADIHETVHEHRAPTDASVRLLAEMQQAAQDRVIEAFPVQFNELHGTFIKYKNDFLQDVWALRFSINGAEYTYTHEMCGHWNCPNQLPQMLEEFQAGFSQFLAAKLLRNFVLPVITRR